MTIRQFLCWLWCRHDDVLHFNGRRMAMRCTSCGWQSKGITA